jgi:hypothetical protein
MGTNRVPLPLTETWGTLPELVLEALAWMLAGVAAALAMAAEAAAIAIAVFMVVCVCVWNENTDSVGKCEV